MMYKGRIAIVAGGLALVLAACSGGTALQTRGGRDRRSVIVLVNDGQGGCLAKTAGVHRAYKNDFVTWDVWSWCDAAKTLDVDFGADNPLTGRLTSQPHGNNRWPDIRGKVAGEPGLYPFTLKVNGTAVVDPDLEIDP